MSEKKSRRGLLKTCAGILAGVGALSGVAIRIQAKPKTVEPHPHLHAALNELSEAKKELKEAAHDFGGHRVAALKALADASAQLQTALKYDKK